MTKSLLLVAVLVSGDSESWPMLGGTPSRNLVSSAKGLSLDFDVIEKKNVLYEVKLGSAVYSSPIVADGRIYAGSNVSLLPHSTGDKGCLYCLDEKTGKLLWQLTRDKHPLGRSVDWPEIGVCSSPCVENGRVYVVTNRAEVMCLDAKGMADGNQGAETNEQWKGPRDADVIWSVDMIGSLGVHPHNSATCSPVLHDGRLYVVTGNGVDDSHRNIPAPDAPSFLCLDAKTGRVVWAKNYPGKGILHGQWSSPCVGTASGKTQIVFPGGDGALYALQPATGELIWKCHLNPVSARGGFGPDSRSEIIAAPVFFENSVIVALGKDPEHGDGVGRLSRIDATKTGDVSAEIGGVIGHVGMGEQTNPNSGILWSLGGKDGQGEMLFRRSISTVAIHDGLVYAAELAGFLKCLDFKTGKVLWEHDLLAAVWGSPLVVDGKVLLGDEDGKLTVFAAGRARQILKEAEFGSAIYTTPTVCNGRLLIAARDRLVAVKTREQRSEDRGQKNR
jgi:outer membrane protein assembly factor BamB